MSIYENLTFTNIATVTVGPNASTTWNGGTITIGGTTDFVNVAGATFTAACDSQITDPAGSFTNNGHFIKTGTSGTTVVTGQFDNKGTSALVSVVTGTLQFLNSSGTDSAEFRTAANTLIQFTSPAGRETHTLNQGTSFTGSGKVKVDSLAELAVANGVGVTASCTFELASAGGLNVGYLSGPGTFTSQSNFIWDGGSIGVLGGMNVNVQGQLNISGANNNQITNSILSTSAAGTWSGTNNIEMAGSTINNSGTLTVTNDQKIDDTTRGNSFMNTGTITKTAGAAGTEIDVPFTNSNGTLNLNGKKIQLNGYDVTQLGANSHTLLGNGGTLGINAPSGTNFVFNVNAGTLSGTGTISGNLSMGGNLDMGATLGTLAVTGDYTQTATGKLTLKLGGVGAGQYDKLNVSGKATLAGTLQLNSINGFVPVKGNTFGSIVHGGKGIAGTFGTITDTTGSGLTWNLATVGNDLNLTGN
jgi:hypothetical protein